MKAVLIALLIMTTSACDSALNVSGGESGAKIAIDGFDRLSAKPGETVTVTGANLTDDLQVSVNGKPATFRRIDEKSGTIEMPSDIDPGLLKVSFSFKSKKLTSITLMNGNSIDNMSTLNIPLDNICNSFIVKIADGELARGKASCNGAQAVCSRDGQTDCKTNAAFPAVAKAGLAAKVLAGKTLAGVSGQASANCGP